MSGFEPHPDEGDRRDRGAGRRSTLGRRHLGRRLRSPAPRRASWRGGRRRRPAHRSHARDHALSAGRCSPRSGSVTTRRWPSRWASRSPNGIRVEQVRRPGDLLVVDLVLVNVATRKIKDRGLYLEIADKQKRAFLAVVLPGQNIGETLGRDPSTPVSQTALALPSVLAFTLPRGWRAPYDLEQLLDWTDLKPAWKKKGDDPVSRIEAPYRLKLKPSAPAVWQHAVAPVARIVGSRTTEVWHTRLVGRPSASAAPDQRVSRYRTVTVDPSAQVEAQAAAQTSAPRPDRRQVGKDPRPGRPAHPVLAGRDARAARQVAGHHRAARVGPPQHDGSRPVRQDRRLGLPRAVGPPGRQGDRDLADDDQPRWRDRRRAATVRHHRPARRRRRHLAGPAPAGRRLRSALQVGPIHCRGHRPAQGLLPGAGAGAVRQRRRP